MRVGPSWRAACCGLSKGSLSRRWGLGALARCANMSHLGWPLGFPSAKWPLQILRAPDARSVILSLGLCFQP